jgi:predicted DCC family thiol-disulfide oxidoreductase YuxK
MNVAGTQQVLLYDGTCALCHWAVNLSRKHVIDKKSIRYLPQESEKGIELINKYNVDTSIDSIYLIYQDKVLYKSQAAFQLIKGTSWKIKWLLIFDIFPRGLMDIGYSFIAKHRKKIFGEVDNCEI